MIKQSSCGMLQTVGRIIGDRAGEAGPTIVFVGGIHGNEPAGVIALQQVFQRLAAEAIPIRGRVLGIAGNLAALAEKKRFISRDLNRLWDNEFTRRYQSRSQNAQPVSQNGYINEFREQIELFELIEPLLSQDGPVYFLDLHTTSSPSVPFIAINDQLNNRRFAIQFPVKKVLGIEEYLEGPLLSYLNDFGHVALAFEAGQHDAPESVDLHESFIYLAMLAAGVIAETNINDMEAHRCRLAAADESQRGVFEVIFRKAVTAEDRFQMNSGYQNFDTISKGEFLAEDRHGPIVAHRRGRIFMPLYQKSGEDGYFIVRSVPRWALRLSSALRKINFDSALTWLPGVSRDPRHPDALVVNKSIAFLLATELFHLLGYRRKKVEGNKLIFSRREIA